jgi:hypothetical protein
MAIKVLFHRVVQDVPEFGSTDAHSVSRVYFDLQVDGEMFSDLYVNVEEPADGSHATEEIRVGELKAALLPLDQEAFKQAVRGYYHSLVTSAGFGKHLAKDKGFRTYENELGMEQVIEL